ncbi:MAG TPA: TonB-dependent receptor [Accumulibacter sp.]|nr:TonB-dependent receptor [Accumulibacter sp.]
MLAAAPVVAGDGWDRHAETIAAQNLEAQTGLTEFALLPGERLAQAGSSPTATLDTVVVEAERPSLTQENLSSAEERLWLISGGVNLIGPQALEEKRSSSLVDALGAQPGIIARSFFGGNDQARLNIRGSGLQQNPVQRGVRLLLDGLPVNLADGSFIIGVLEPRTTQYIEVYRGANGARYGATTLGGAINFIAPTGYDHGFSRASLEGGSFGFISALAATGDQLGDGDYFAGLTHNQRDGYRDYSASDRQSFSANYGLRQADWESRFFLNYVNLDFEVPGPLPKATLESDPESVHDGPVVILNPGRPPTVTQPGPNVPRDRPERKVEQARLANRTTLLLGNAQEIDAGLSYLRTDDRFRFPVSTGLVESPSDDLAAELRYRRLAPVAGRENRFELGMNASWGQIDRRRFHNDRGATGALYADNELTANNFALFAENTFFLRHEWALVTALQYSYAGRDSDDRYDSPTRPTLRVAGPPPGPIPPAVPAEDTSFDRDYHGFNPRLGLIYRFDPVNQLFFNVSRSFEAPTFDDLLVATGGTPNSGPLKFTAQDLDAQTATTLEIGTRGDYRQLRWNLTLYRARIEDELLSLRDATGSPLGTVNADRTLHRGLELELMLRFPERLNWRLVYNYQDFRFDGDPVYGDNALGGALEHLIDASVRYDHPNGFWVAADVQWLPTKVPVDNANTLFQDPYTVWGLRAGYRKGNLTVFADARNLFDETYASATLVTDRAAPDQAAFLPGDGRSFSVGADYRF